MKSQIITIITIFFCLITACTELKTETYKQLEKVDSLSRHDQHDSAKIILSTMKEELLTNKEKALYNILTIRLYGTPEFISRIDTMLNFSESYYKSLSDSTHLAEVYLYKGDVCYFYKPQYDSSAYFLKKAKNFATQKKTDHFLLSQIYWYQQLVHALSGEYQEMVHDAENQTFHAEKSGSKRQSAYAALNTVIALKHANKTDKLDLKIQAALNWSNYLKKEDLSFIYNLYGELYMNTQPERAKENFNKALAIQPNSKYTQKNLAQLYFNQGDIKQAEDFCAKCSNNNWSEDQINILTILVECKIATNKLNEAIEIQKRIISEKDSIINRINKNLTKNAILTPQHQVINIKNNEYIVYIVTCFFAISTITLTILYFIQRAEIKQISKKNDNNQQEKYFIGILEGIEDKNMAQWDKKMQLDFIDYYTTKYPEVINQIETEYEPLTPTLMILQILAQTKAPKEIQKTMCITESSYYSYLSRIKKAKKTKN